MFELTEVSLLLEEYEALRLADVKGLYQIKAAVSMGVSRATFGNILSSARKKVSDALINGRALRIECPDERRPQSTVATGGCMRDAKKADKRCGNKR